MKLNLKMKDCRFFVNDAEGVVTCIIPHTCDLFYEYIFDFPCYNMVDISKGKYNMPNSFRGVARCAKTDTFDVDTGKLIAYSKARNKLYTSFFKRAQLFANEIDKEYTNYVDEINAFGAKIAARSDKLEAIIAEKVAE